MTDTAPAPICPTCGYDLAGIIREDNTTTCPECGSKSDSFRNTLPISRWPTIHKLIIAHILLMIVVNAILVVPLGASSGWIWFLMQFVIMPAGVVFTEHRLRISNPPKNYTPTITQLSFFVVFYTIALLILGYTTLSIVAYSTLY